MKTVLQQTLWRGKRVSIPIANSGVDSNGSPRSDGTLGDLNFQLVSVPSGSNVIRIRTSVGGYPIGPWMADNNLSAWMVPNNDSAGDSPDGSYVYQATLDLSRYDPKSIVVRGQLAADDAVIAFVINGVYFPQYIPGFNVFKQFSISTGFIKGINTIGFAVDNDAISSTNPTGFRVELKASGVRQ